MKKITNSIVLMAIAGLMMYSCSTKDDLPIESPANTITNSDTTILDCFTPLQDITIYIGEDTLILSDDSDFSEILETWLTEMEPFSIQFPIDIELADGTILTLNNMDDLIEVLIDCGVDFDAHDDDDAESDDDTDDDADHDDDESDDDTDYYDDCIIISPCGTYTYQDGISISSDSLNGEITIIVYDDNMAIDTITCQGTGAIELTCGHDDSDDDSDSDDDTDDSDDDTDESDDDTDDDTDDSDDDTDESDDDTDGSDDDTDGN